MLCLSGRLVPTGASAIQMTNVQFNFSVLYQRGKGVTQNDWLAFACTAEQGMTRAQQNHTTAYANGLGTNVNYTGAFEWMTRATEAGLNASQYSLAS